MDGPGVGNGREGVGVPVYHDLRRQAATLQMSGFHEFSLFSVSNAGWAHYAVVSLPYRRYTGVSGWLCRYGNSLAKLLFYCSLNSPLMTISLHLSHE